MASDLRWMSYHGNESSIFYRLILPSTLHDNKLRIPGKFVKKIGGDLSSVAALTTPNGYVWSVRLQKIDDKIWFTQGWHDFVEHQSIRVGYLLVFTYKGNSNFGVNIFDMTSAEIKYQCMNQFPLSTGRGAGEGRKYEQNYPLGANSFNLEDRRVMRGGGLQLGDIQSAGRSSRDIGIQCNLSDVMSSAFEMRMQSFNQQPETPRKRKRGRPASTKGSEIQAPRTEPSSGTFFRKWRVITPEEKERVLNASKMFESENPFCRVFLRRSYVNKGIGLHMPSSFAEKYLCGVTGFVTLQVSNGEKWPIRCLWRDGSAKLSKGWLEFVRDNHLEEGDVCIFEVIKMGEVVLKVTIFRLPQEALLLNQFPEGHPGHTPHACQLPNVYDIKGRNL